MAAASSRNVRLAWLLVGCPAVGWVTVIYAEHATRGRLGAFGDFLLLLALPAALAAWGGTALGGSRRFAVLAGISAAMVAFVGATAYVVYFLLTVPDGFFN